MHKYWLMALVFTPDTFAFSRTHICIFLCYLKRIFLFHDKTIQNTGRGHYLLVKHKPKATDTNSQASCALAALFLSSQWCPQKQSISKLFVLLLENLKRIYRRSYYGIYCRKRCHLAFFFLLLSLYICLTGYTDKCFLQLKPLLLLPFYR